MTENIFNDVRTHAFAWADKSKYWTNEDDVHDRNQEWAEIEIEYLRNRNYYCTFNIIIHPAPSDYGVSVTFLAHKYKKDKDGEAPVICSAFKFPQSEIRTILEHGSSPYLLWQSIRKDAEIIISTLEIVQEVYDKDFKADRKKK